MTGHPDPGQLLSVADAAELLGLHPDTVRRWIASGELPAVRLGYRTLRIARAALDAYVAERVGRATS